MTAPPLTDQQAAKMKALWNGGAYFGRDKLYSMLSRDPENDISRRQVADYLAQNELAQTFRRPLRRTGVKAIVASKLGSLQADTMDMSAQSFQGYIAIFSAIDVYSKRLYCIPLKSKSASATTYALKQILRSNPNVKVSTITTDNGGEFSSEFDTFLEERGIQHHRTKAHSPWSNGVVERSNASVRKQISMHMLAQKTRNWPAALDMLVENINNSVSAATGKTPNEIEAAEENSEVRLSAAAKIKNRAAKSVHVRGATTLQLGDTVRKVLTYNPSGIQKPSRTGYFAPEKFTIHKVVQSRFANQLPSYKLETEDGHVLTGLYARSQLLYIPDASQKLARAPQIADNQNDEEEEEETVPRRSLRQEGVFEIAYLHGKRRRKNKIQYLARWLGYPESESTWEYISNLKNARQAIQEYEARL